MTDRTCVVCGASNPPGTAFCRVCDTYIDWAAPDPASAATDGAPTTSPTAAAGATTGPTPSAAGNASPSAADDAPATGAGDAPPIAAEDASPRPDRAEAPVASVAEGIVVVAPGMPGTTSVTLRNVSDIVDGIVIHPEVAPPWLVLTHEDAHLLPGESKTVVVTFA